MSIISNIFKELDRSGKKAFIPFITAGDGGLDNSEALVFSLADNGADIIELGVPFSDPMADGPVIAKSHERAVADGVSLSDVLAIVERFREHNQSTGIVLMGWNFLFIGGTNLLPRSYNENEKFKVQSINDFLIFGFQAFAALSAGWFVFNYSWEITMLSVIPILVFQLLLLLWWLKYDKQES